MKILAVNAGSSSLKVQLIEMPEEKQLAKALVERIGKEDAIFTLKYRDKEGKDGAFKIPKTPILNHLKAVELMVSKLQEFHLIENPEDIKACAHRIVQGGEYFSKTEIVTEEVSKRVLELKELAPHHNKAEHDGYLSCRQYFPKALHTMSFDTAFHQTIPEERYIYPLPYRYYTDYKIRRYGAHGTSHQYIASAVREYYGENVNTISCHLGSGASICAIQEGKSVDTSMGFTPLGGICMGTRCGDLDPSVLFYIMNKESRTPDEMNQICNFESGLLGVSAYSDSMRQIEEAREQKDPQAALAHKIYCLKAAQFIGAYHLELGGARCIVFTAGVGENSKTTRQVLLSMISKALGIVTDEEHPVPILGGKGFKISREESKIDVLVIPTNEELMMCRDAYRLIEKNC